jgi:hypothetical protein
MAQVPPGGDAKIDAALKKVLPRLQQNPRRVATSKQLDRFAAAHEGFGASTTLKTNAERLNVWNVVSYPTWSQWGLESERDTLLRMVGVFYELGLVDDSGTEIEPGMWLNIVRTLVHTGTTRNQIDSQKICAQTLLNNFMDMRGLLTPLVVFRRCCAILPDPDVVRALASLLPVSTLTADDEDMLEKLSQYSHFYYGAQGAVKPEPGVVMAFISKRDPFGWLRARIDAALPATVVA